MKKLSLNFDVVKPKFEKSREVRDSIPVFTANVADYHFTLQQSAYVDNMWMIYQKNELIGSVPTFAEAEEAVELYLKHEVIKMQLKIQKLIVKTNI